MYKSTILALALFAVILSWQASNAKLFLEDVELEELDEDLELANTKKTTATKAKGKPTTTTKDKGKTATKGGKSKSKTETKKKGKGGKGDDDKKGKKTTTTTKTEVKGKTVGGLPWYWWALIVVAVLALVLGLCKYFANDEHDKGTNYEEMQHGK